MSPLPIGEIIQLALSITDKLMDKIPNYEQRKREQFHKLRDKYEKEIVKNYPDRDDTRIDDYRDNLLRFLQDFNKEVAG